MQYSYNKQEKLKSRKFIKELFENGQTLSVYPLRLVYLKKEHDGLYALKMSVSVSKRNFKLAVSRNRIKRVMREVYRLNKHYLYNNLEHKYVFMFIYLGRKEVEYQLLDSKMKALSKLFINKIKNN